MARGDLWPRRFLPRLVELEAFCFPLEATAAEGGELASEGGATEPIGGCLLTSRGVEAFSFPFEATAAEADASAAETEAME